MKPAIRLILAAGLAAAMAACASAPPPPPDYPPRRPYDAKTQLETGRRY